MAEIAIEQDLYKSYILSDPNAQSRLEVVPERGGIVTRWRIQGQDIFYLDEERFKDPKLSVRGGNPILFPICGNLPEDTYTHDGKSYPLKQHGFARELPWEVRDTHTDERGAALTVALQSNEKTRAVYPFDFEVEYTYRLQGMSLAIEQRYTNRSDQPLPFSAGFHPYFWCVDKSQLEFELPAAQQQGKEASQAQPFDGSFDFEVEEIDVALRPLTGHTAIMRDRRRKLQLEMSFSEIFTTLVFWTVKGKNFVCLEPWSAPRNAMNTGEDLIRVEPGASCEARVELSVSYR